MSRLRLTTTLVAAALASTLAAPATPAATHGISTAAAHTIVVRNDRLPLHAGSGGPLVAKAQYLIRAPRPRQNPFTLIKGTFHHQPNGLFGARTKSAVVAYKYRFGFPHKGQCGAPVDLVIPTVGQHFFDLLDRHATRPACWVALAASRLKAIVPGPSLLAVKAKNYELELLAANIHEIPDGANRGPAISYTATLHGHTIRALQSSTGAYGQAWCVSTQQAVMKAIGYGTFANATAGVYYTVDYYAARNQLVAKARVGELVAFITYDRYGHRVTGTGHLGFVMAVQASTFTYAAGNDGNAFREHTIPMGSRPYAFIALRGLA
jgi:hypothetical protein